MIKKTLYFGNPAYLSLKNKQLVIKIPEIERNKELPEIIRKESVRTIPIEDIGVVVLDHKEITITQSVIAALLDNTYADRNALTIAREYDTKRAIQKSTQRLFTIEKTTMATNNKSENRKPSICAPSQHRALYR